MTLEELKKIKESLEECGPDVENFSWGPSLSFAQDRKKAAMKILNREIRKLKEANAFYGVIIISTLIGLGINFSNVDTFKVLIYTAIGNGLIAPVVLVLIVLLSSNKKVMGDRVNGPITKILGWTITLIMTAVGIATIYSFF